MAKDFDSDPDGRRGSRLALEREFKLGGETFRLRSGLKVGTDVLEEWRRVLNIISTRTRWERAEALHAVGEGPAPGEAPPPVEDSDFAPVARQTLLDLLEPGQAATLEKVLSNDADPIMIPDLFEVVFWAVGVVTGRPTDASSPSSSGSTAPTTEPVEPSSTGDSSSPEAAASAA